MPETRNVLMQRVIALNGVAERPANTANTANAPKTADSDLSRTVHEWSAHENAPSSSASQPMVQRHAPTHDSQGSVDAQWATHSSISLEFSDATQLAPRILNSNVEDAVTQQFATNAQALGSSIADLASLDRALESAGVLEAQELCAITNFRQPAPVEPGPPVASSPTQAAPTPAPPRMLLVPAAIVWTVLTVFSLCALALTFLVVAYFLREQLHIF
jgi:hypothetical protein